MPLGRTAANEVDCVEPPCLLLEIAARAPATWKKVGFGAAANEKDRCVHVSDQEVSTPSPGRTLTYWSMPAEFASVGLPRTSRTGVAAVVSASSTALRPEDHLLDVGILVERAGLDGLDAEQLDRPGEGEDLARVPIGLGMAADGAVADELHRRRQLRREALEGEAGVERARADAFELAAEREAREARRVAERGVRDVGDGRKVECPVAALVVVEGPGADLDDRPLVAGRVDDALREVERAGVADAARRVGAAGGHAVAAVAVGAPEHERPVGFAQHGHVERLDAVGHRDVARRSGERPVGERGRRERGEAEG